MPVFFILVGFIWLSWLAQGQAQSPLFSPASGSPVKVGQGSGQVILADVNRDGQLDLITRHLQQQLVTVQLGDGQGDFAAAAQSRLTLGYLPGGMTLGDVNHDSLPDLAVMKNDQDRVDIFFGNGQGGFSLAPGSPFMISTSVYSLTKPSLHMLDVNEDGHPDFVMTNGRHNTIAILLGDGQGRFIPGPLTHLGAGQDYYSAAFGDVDGDGHLDAVLVTSKMAEAGRIETWRGNGTGAFRATFGFTLLGLADPRIAALAHINNDEHLDVVLNHSSKHLSVLLNHRNGTFAPASTSPYPLAAQAFAVVVRDINQDQQVDLIAATVNSQEPPFESDVTVLLGKGHT